MTHEDYKELLAANALTALDAADARVLSAHLEGCCRMPFGNERGGKTRLRCCRLQCSTARTVCSACANKSLRRVRAEKPTSSVIRNQRHHRWPKDQQCCRLNDRKEMSGRRLRSFGAIAAALAVCRSDHCAGGSVAAKPRDSKSNWRRLSSEMKQTQAQLDHERAVVELLTAPDARMTKLAGTPMAPGAHAMLAYNQSGHAMLMAKGLPAAPEGWRISSGSSRTTRKCPARCLRSMLREWNA